MQTQVNGAGQISSIQFEITKLRLFLDEELRDKKEVIRQKDNQLSECKQAIAKKDAIIAALEFKLQEQEEQTAGNHQLINKLLGDISKLSNDIDWYQRTYEKRSFLGVVKEKILNKK